MIPYTIYFTLHYPTRDLRRKLGLLKQWCMPPCLQLRWSNDRKTAVWSWNSNDYYQSPETALVCTYVIVVQCINWPCIHSLIYSLLSELLCRWERSLFHHLLKQNNRKSFKNLEIISDSYNKLQINFARPKFVTTRSKGRINIIMVLFLKIGNLIIMKYLITTKFNLACYCCMTGGDWES